MPEEGRSEGHQLGHVAKVGAHRVLGSAPLDREVVPEELDGLLHPDPDAGIVAQARASRDFRPVRRPTGRAAFDWQGNRSRLQA
jgi:hypothetical protein